VISEAGVQGGVAYWYGTSERAQSLEFKPQSQKKGEKKQNNKLQNLECKQKSSVLKLSAV
jgi:hypothetical protein